MSDRFRTSEHIAGVGDSNIALAHTLYGQPTETHQRAEQTGNPNAGRATWSTAPYIPPKRRDHDNPDKELCSEEGCLAWPKKGMPYCIGHARKRGLMPVCSKRDCGGPPMGDTGYCYYHQPKPAVTEDELFDVDAG